MSDAEAKQMHQMSMHPYLPCRRHKLCQLSPVQHTVPQLHMVPAWYITHNIHTPATTAWLALSTHFPQAHFQLFMHPDSDKTVLFIHKDSLEKTKGNLANLSSPGKGKQEGLAVASIARDDTSTLPGDDPFPRAH